MRKHNREAGGQGTSKTGLTCAVVTPWTDHEDLWEDYSEAIDAAQPDQVLIVDNASEPPLAFAQIRLEANLGFCGGSNVGLRAATTDIVVFLNNDVALTSGDWLTKLLAALEPGVLVGARLRTDRHADVDGHPMPYLDGWCLAGTRDDFRTLGGWNTQLAEPAYYSDNLLCLEARAAGMTLREVPVGLHHKNFTSGRMLARDHVQRVTLENQARYQERARELLVAA